MTDRSAKLAPYPKELKSSGQLMLELNELLKVEYCLDPLPLYTLVVEGWSDVKYLLAAAALARNRGSDLLSATSPVDGATIPIGIITPGRRNDPSRGGVEQVVRLARDIKAAVFAYDAYHGVAFVFDHDDAGIKGRDEVAQHGFLGDKHTITLDPKRHPLACAKKQVVVEDLLSLRVQTAFFSQGSAWCSAEYEAGALKRYVWGHASKGALQAFVASNAAWEDLIEVARVLVRVREMWGLPVDDALFASPAPPP